VMDDEPMFREVVGETLRRLGYSVTLARHGDEAIALHAVAEKDDSPFDIVLLDLTVRGGKGGSETMQVLQAREPGVHAVLMSGYTSDEAFRDYARHGFRAALSKPFSIETLNATIAGILGAGGVRRRSA
jgi:two-component system, cell cycle sensor histidine kinase and response regulator CckA